MELTKLEIKGFKSFGDKITINFNEGVTAIVGPNGCGKSNVVDAIRWVLGEQSTKTLRSEKMENIIFNGTQSRKPANLAEVSLTFNNNKKVLPTEFTTVTITRKLYRTGESEYRLNDVKCRLKDITDLFLDTGIGTDTYSIIELKMIDEIISNKDNSRRTLFEEASGISKYKVRKKQTINKLKETEADLSRVDDILYEITKNLKSLESQAKKADKYFLVKEEYRKASINLAYYKLDGFSQNLTLLTTKEKDLQTKVNTTLDQIDTKEKVLNSGREEVLIKEQNLATQHKLTNEFIHKIHRLESDKKLKNERIHNLKEREALVITELNLDKQQLENVEYSLKRLHEDVYEEKAKLDVLQADMENQKEGVDVLRKQQEIAKKDLDNFVGDINTLQNEIYRVEKDIAVLNIQKESLEQEALRNLQEASSKSEELTQFNVALSEIQEKLDIQQESFDGVIAQEESLNVKINQAESHLEELKGILAKKSRLVDAKQNEYSLTKSLVDNLEGFPESIKFLRKNAGWTKNYPLLSDILFCQEEYRVAIENYLEPVMNHYVVDTQQNAIQAIQLLSDSSRGRANFFILEDVKPSGIEENIVIPDTMIPALQVVKLDSKYKALGVELLKNVYLLKSESGLELDVKLPSEKSIVLQHEGRFSKHKFGLSGGSVGLFEGKRIGRAKNLENLTKEIKSLNTEIDTTQDEVIKQADLISSLKSQSQKNVIDELRILLSRLQNEWTSVKTKQEQYQSFINTSQNRKKEIEKSLLLISEQLTANEPALKILKVEMEQGQKQLLSLQTTFQEFNDAVLEKSTAYNQENIRLHQQQNKVSGIQKDLEYRESQKDALENRIIKNNIEQEKIKAEIQDSITLTHDGDVDVKGLYEEKEALELALNKMEEEFYAFRKSMNDQEQQLSDLRRSKDQHELLLNDIKDKKTELQIELNSLKERLSVEFGIDMKELLENDLPEIVESQEELTSLCGKLKKQLDDFGSINPMAKEAYDEIAERNDFINKEKNDLLEAKSSLLSTIDEIDENANKKFMNAFTSVRDNFVKVFRSLFNEEDSCDLVLTDPKNPLESDIEIIAQPKGKRPLSINQLSGGEKTLTSTALLFSLYLLKPAPFCIFDEVDAPLDDTNIDKFNNIIKDFANDSQFIIVSHNKRTIASTDIIYGVTMVEQGISRVVPVDLRDVA